MLDRIVKSLTPLSKVSSSIFMDKNNDRRVYLRFNGPIKLHFKRLQIFKSIRPKKENQMHIK